MFSIIQETLKVHQMDSVQLYHTLSQTSAVMRAFLTSEVCNANGDQCEPSMCSQMWQPDQQLTCTIIDSILPRLRNYNDLLTAEVSVVTDFAIKASTYISGMNPHS